MAPQSDHPGAQRPGARKIGMGKVIQVRLIVGGSKYLPDIGSELIAGYKDGWSHVDSIVPAGLPWAPEGWLYGARNDALSAAKCQAVQPVTDLLLGGSLIRARANRLGIPSGVQLRPPGYTTFRRCVILTVPVTDRQWADFWIAEWAKLGRPYDWRSIISFAAPFGWTRDWHETDSWICSEKDEDSFEKGKILSAFWLAPWKISPGMFAARVEVLPGVWSTDIKPGTDPTQEAAIAQDDWQRHLISQEPAAT